MGVYQTRGALGNGRIGAIMKSLGKPGQVDATEGRRGRRTSLRQLV